MTPPKPKPTLLTSLGVSGGDSPPPAPINGEEAAPTTDASGGEEASERSIRPPDPHSADPRPAPRRRRRAPTGAPSSLAATHQTTESSATAAIALDRIRQRHKERRGAGVRLPKAPLNVDLPLPLLDHIRELAQDIPYPLRRIAEEALELWLEATGNALPATPDTTTTSVGE